MLFSFQSKDRSNYLNLDHVRKVHFTNSIDNCKATVTFENGDEESCNFSNCDLELWNEPDTIIAAPTCLTVLQPTEFDDEKGEYHYGVEEIPIVALRIMRGYIYPITFDSDFNNGGAKSCLNNWAYKYNDLIISNEGFVQPISIEQWKETSIEELKRNRAKA